MSLGLAQQFHVNPRTESSWLPKRYSAHLHTPPGTPSTMVNTPEFASTHRLPVNNVKPIFEVDREVTVHNAERILEENRQKNLISRSLSVQPAMSTHTHSFIPIDQDRRLTAMEETIRRPFLFHAKFGSPSNWALDILTLPHNAIRAECVDLYSILESIKARTDNVKLAELEEFSTWWTTFDLFIIEYFDFEADILLSFALPNAKDASTNSLVPEFAKSKSNSVVALRKSLIAMKEQLLESLLAINNTFELRRHVDAQDVFQTVLKDVNEFVPKLIEYFRLQERHIPQIVSQMHPPDVREVITRKYLNYIRRGEAPQMNIAILARWMDKPVRERWVKANLRGLSRLMFPRWERKCYKEHAHIPAKFHRRLLRSVRNVAASRLRRRTEFGEEIEDISYGSLASPTGSFRSLTLAINSRSSSTLKPGRSRETSRSRGKLR